MDVQLAWIQRLSLEDARCAASPASPRYPVQSSANATRSVRRPGRLGWPKTMGVVIGLASACLMTAAAEASVSGCSQGSSFGRFLVSDVGPGFACYIGDKQYSNFTDFRDMRSDDIFEISQSDPNNMTHQLTVKAGGSGFFTPSTSYKITYDVTVWTGDNVLRSYATGVETTDNSANWIKQLKSINPKDESITITNPTTTSSPEYFDSNNVKSATFISELTVNASVSGVDLWKDILSQRQFVPDPVPAPLPLIGGGTAWHFSRRLRRRIRDRSH